MPPRRKKRRSSALTRIMGSPYEISKIVPKMASEAYSASASAFDESKKSIYSLGIGSKKSIKKGHNRAKKELKKFVSDVPQVSNARAFMDLLEPLNDKWISVTIPGNVFARGVEDFMKKHKTGGTKHIIGESEIRSVMGLLYGPASYSQIPAILSQIFPNKSSVSSETVSEMLDILFSDFVNAEKNYQDSVSVKSMGEPGLGFQAMKIQKLDESLKNMTRTDVIIKLTNNLKAQAKYLKAPKLKHPSPSDLFEMNILQKEALGLIDKYREDLGLSDEDPEIESLYRKYVLPLNEKYPELDKNRNKGATRKNKSKKKTPKRKGAKGKKKKTRRRTYNGGWLY